MSEVAKGRRIKCKICQTEFSMCTSEEREEWQRKKLPCPSCKTEYCNLPKTERELRHKHNTFYDSSTTAFMKNQILGEMYLILCEYAKSLILKCYRSKIQSADQLEQFSHDAATLIIQIYQTKEGGVHSSFGGLLILKIKEVMFSKQEYTRDISLNEIMDTHNAQFEAPEKQPVPSENLLDKIVSEIVKDYDNRITMLHLFQIYFHQKNIIHTKLRNKKINAFFSVYSKKYIKKYELILDDIKILLANL